jgi:hypothetical protein
MSVDVSVMYNGGPTSISVPAMSVVHMAGLSAVNVSKNYAEMFEIDHIHQ